ncbi:hypothetical protein BMT63_09055 [Escherichia coli]|nr:hypothetical protein BMT64_13020 [Escherichia coli]OOH89148.1 hypothetical protein BMT63_09055 [Escherichia coli]
MRRERLIRPTKSLKFNILHHPRRPDKRSASGNSVFVIRKKGRSCDRPFFIKCVYAFFRTSLTISTASFSICLRCSSPRKLSQ